MADDAGPRLVQAMRRVAGTNVSLHVEEHACRAWQSITFAGARHRLCVRLEGERAGRAARRLLHQLACGELALRGHLLADAQAALIDGEEPRASRVQIEALTVEAA